MYIWKNKYFRPIDLSGISIAIGNTLTNINDSNPGPGSCRKHGNLCKHSLQTPDQQESALEQLLSIYNEIRKQFDRERSDEANRMD